MDIIIDWVPFLACLLPCVLFAFGYGSHVERCKWNKLIEEGRIPKPYRGKQ